MLGSLCAPQPLQNAIVGSIFICIWVGHKEDSGVEVLRNTIEVDTMHCEGTKIKMDQWGMFHVSMVTTVVDIGRSNAGAMTKEVVTTVERKNKRDYNMEEEVEYSGG